MEVDVAPGPVHALPHTCLFKQRWVAQPFVRGPITGRNHLQQFVGQPP